MRSIEIPRPDERGPIYRFFEILPGLLTWSILILPLVLGFLSPKAAAYFIIAYILIWFFRAIVLNFRIIQGWRHMNHYCRLPWSKMNQDLEALEARVTDVPRWHQRNLRRVEERLGHKRIKPSQVYHIIIIAIYNEPRGIIEPTIQSILNSEHDLKKVLVYLAYEERGGAAVAEVVESLVKQHRHHFYHMVAVRHPHDIAGEIIGKGGNITYAARQMLKFIRGNSIDPDHVLVTTLDSDTRPHPKYLASLTYTYCSTEDPKHSSYQPVAMYTNNIWDAPAPMRVIATGNSFWIGVVPSMRQHLLRNFSAHAQPLSALIDTDFWSVRSIVEDGHQYWRSYFRFDGQYEVFPIYTPIYQDAVLAETFRKTLKAQFLQLRRWAYGASDIAYVSYMGFFKPNHIPRHKLIAKWLRLLESHVSWSTASLILAFSALIPFLLHPQNFIANQLPQVVSKLETAAMIGIVITLFLSFKTLPPKPERYKRRRTFWMVLQWAYLPVTSIIFSAFAAINAQTRLIFGWYIDKFDVTEKAVKK